MRYAFLAALLTAAAAGVCAAQVSDLVVARAGNLPIVLTVPHGGRMMVDGARVRTIGTMTTDARTLEFTEALASRLNAILGSEPYVVAARFRRDYIDANRPEREAFEDPAAKAHYLAYHNHVRVFVAEVRKRFPAGGLLLDVHGQATDPDIVHRGTQDGATVARLIREHGTRALVGDKSLFGVLQSRGITVFPPNTSLRNPPEDRRYNGGFTVQAYGSNRPDGIDAIQLELGMNLRTAPGFVDDLAEAVVAHYKAYLLPGEPQ